MERDSNIMKIVLAPCTLRTHRRTWGLSQRDLADLLGFESPTQISRLEHGKRIPGLETALVCSTLFGVPLAELFPQLAIEFDAHLRERANRLQAGLLYSTSVLNSRKRALLTHALGGGSAKHNRRGI